MNLRKRDVILLFSLIFCSESALSDEIATAISSLGVTKAQFSDLWTNVCNPDFALKVPASARDNAKSIVKPGIQAGFIATETLPTRELSLTPGPVCRALTHYYFEQAANEPLIAPFIQADQAFISRFGFSSLDAWGLERYWSASMNGRIDGFVLAHWKHLEKKGLIKIQTEDASFNGEPSNAYFSTVTKAGEALEQALLRAN